MKRFTLVQKVRNKIRIKGSVDLEIDKTAKISKCKIEIKGKNNKLIIGKGVVIRDTQIEILDENSVIEIGDNTVIGHGSYLCAKEGKILKIGNGCMFSRNVKIMTSDGHPIFYNKQRINDAQDIYIGSSVWLADNVTVLKGVSIQKSCIVGINSTLTHSLNEGEIAAGNPAKVIKQGVSWQI